MDDVPASTVGRMSRNTSVETDYVSNRRKRRPVAHSPTMVAGELPENTVSMVTHLLAPALIRNHLRGDARTDVGWMPERGAVEKHYLDSGCGSQRWGVGSCTRVHT